MNEKLNLVDILKDCPKGMELDCTVYNDVTFLKVDDVQNRCYFKAGPADTFWTTCEGRINGSPYGKCVVFPKGKTIWEGFKPKKQRFDPKTLMAFDKVLVRLTKDCIWNATFFSHYDKEVNWGCYPCVTTSCKSYNKCIPYNDETKHLLGTSDEVPEYYRYWED